MTMQAAPINEQVPEADEQLKNLAGFLDTLVQIDLANKEIED